MLGGNTAMDLALRKPTRPLTLEVCAWSVFIGTSKLTTRSCSATPMKDSQNTTHACAGTRVPAKKGLLRPPPAFNCGFGLSVEAREALSARMPAVRARTPSSNEKLHTHEGQQL